MEYAVKNSIPLPGIAETAVRVVEAKRAEEIEELEFLWQMICERK